MADLPSPDEFFGTKSQQQGVAALPTPDEFFAPQQEKPGFISRTLNQFNPFTAFGTFEAPPTSTPAGDIAFSLTSKGRILNAFGQGVKQGWGTESVAIPDPVQQVLKSTGFWDEYANTRNQHLKSFNEVLFRPAAAMLDRFLGPVATDINAAVRGGSALLRGASEAAYQAGKEAGQPALGREVAGMIEYAGMTGIPELSMGLPRAPAVRIPEARRMGVIGEGEGGYFGTKAPEPITEAARADAAKQMVHEMDAAPEPTGAAPEGSLMPEAAAAPEPAVAAVQPPDIHQVARTIAPDTFREYDMLYQRRDTYSRWMRELRETRLEKAEADAPHAAEIESLTAKLDEASPRMRKKYEARLEAMEAEREAFIEKAMEGENADIAKVREEFQKADYRMRDLGPEVSAAYRQARERSPEEIASEAPTPADASRETAAPVEAAPDVASPDAIPAEIAEPAAAQAAEQPTGPNAAGESLGGAKTFKTAKGSVYELHSDGTTTRNKAARSDAGHEGDHGLKPRSVKTVYLDTADMASSLSAAGLSGLGPKGARVIIKDGKASLLTWNEKAGKWGRSPSGKDVPFSTEPGVGKAPLELWKPAKDVPGYEAYSGMHAGNLITEMTESAPAAPPKAEQVKAISKDVAKKLELAGRPKSEAAAAGDLIAAHYEARAARFEGDVNAYHLFAKEAPNIRAGGSARAKELAQGGKTLAQEVFDWEKPGGGVRVTKVGDTEVTYGVGKDGTAELTLVKTPKAKRGAGSARAALEQFVDEADARGITIRLTAEPMDKGVSKAKLEDFYKSLGFKPNKGRNKDFSTRAGMIREPLPARTLEQSKKGTITLGNARNTIKLFKDADASTFIHETGHDWLEELFRDSKAETVKQFVKDDAESVRKWLGMEEGSEITTRQHEKFARGFERYMMEGVAPSKGLAKVFEQFKEWLTKIYQTVQKLRSPINDDIRAVFDRMLAENPEKQTVIAPDRETTRSMAELHEFEAESMAPDQAATGADQIRADIDDSIKRIAPEVHDELPHREAGAKPRADEVPDRGGDAAQPERGAEVGADERGAVAESGNPVAEESAPAQPEPGTVNESTRTERNETGEPNSANEQFGPTETEYLDKAGNIRLDNLSTPEDVNSVIRQISTENSDFITERRGVMSDAEVIELADSLGMDAGTLDKRKIGEAFNAEQIVAARKLLINSATNVRELMNKAASGSDADVLAYAAARDRHIMIQRQVAGVTAEAGRALRAFRKLEGQQDAELLSKIIQDETGRTLNQLKQEAAMGAQLDSPAKVSKFLNDSTKPKFTDMILEFWINSLLSGPKTHIKNILGNTFVAINSVAETAVASGVGKVLGSADRVALNEAKARAFGIMQGAKEGVSAAKAIFASEDAMLASQAHTVEKAHQPAIPGMIGKAIRIPTRALSMEDEVFKAIGYRQELNALAYREANKLGLTGDAFNAKVADIVTSPPEAMMELARKNAEYQTFTNSLGPTGRAIQNFANSHFLAKFLVPFIRTPVNLLKFAGERTVLGLASTNIRGKVAGAEGTIVRDTQIARMAIGTSIAVASVALALEGNVTGGGPSDTKQRAALRMTGWQPYSVRVGEMYYSYQWLDPFSTIGGISADMADIAKFGAAKDEDHQKIAADLMGSLVKSAASKTSLRGISSFLQMASDPDRYGENYIAGFAAGFVPGILGQLNPDPVVRQSRGVIDEMKAKIPYLSDDLLPRRDIWGNEMQKGGALGPDIASSIYESAVNDDPVNKAMLDAGYFPSYPSRKIRGVELTDQQYDDFSRISGRMAKMQLDTIVRLPGFSQLPALERLTLMRSTVESSRETARSLLMLQNPALMQQAIQSKVRAEMGTAEP